MKDILLKNFEKVLLTLLLVVLAGCSVFMILTMDRDTINIVKEGLGEGVSSVEVKLWTVDPVALESEKPQPYDSKGYIYCRSLDCNYLIHRSLPKCPWCETKTSPPEEKGKSDKLDTDDDGIPDKIEIKVGLNPNDASDAQQDKDQDGFSNLDEITNKRDISDADDHPSIINRSKLHAKIRRVKYYPITFANFGINKEDDKKTWDIYADIYIRGVKRSIFKRINEPIEEIGYTIIDVNRVDGKESITIQKEGEDPVVIAAGPKPKAQSVEYILQNLLHAKKYATFQLGANFELIDKNGNKEKYKAESFDASKRELLIIDFKNAVKVKIGLEPIMNEPGLKEASDPRGDLGIEGLLR